MFEKRFYIVILMFFPLFYFVNGGNKVCSAANKNKIKITSSAFKNGKLIPNKYACDGDDVSPPISWSSVPDGTESIAIITDDPDAPGGTFVHWVIYDIPGDITELSEEISSDDALEDGTQQGTNDFGNIGYNGPCPPKGTHRYYFKIYALDKETGIDPGATKEDLVNAMKGHILGEGKLMGKYKSS